MLRSARTLRALAVLGLLSVHGAVLLLQQFELGPPWLAELTRFLPYYWLLLPTLGALVLALGLSRWLLAACVLNLLLLGTLTMGLQWRLGEPDDSAPGQTLRVLSYNVKALNARHKDGGFGDIDLEVRAHTPDIVALQDAQHLLPLDPHDTPTLSQPIFGLPHVYALDQYVIASRFAVRECKAGSLSRRKLETPQLYLHCQLDVNGRTLDVVTAHFVSPRDALQAERHGPLAGMQDWIANLQERYGQAQLLLQGLAKLPRPLLVMGDFNAPEASPVVADLKRAGLRDSFAQAGKGYGFTYGHALDRKTDFLRIDHILASSELVVLSSEVGGGEASDHSPVLAVIKIP